MTRSETADLIAAANVARAERGEPPLPDDEYTRDVAAMVASEMMPPILERFRSKMN